MKIGTAIKNCRIEKGISQTELALLIEVSRTSLSQIENNLKQPSKTTLSKLSSKLGVPEVYFSLMALEKDDVPESRKELYDTLFPVIKDMINKLVI